MTSRLKFSEVVKVINRSGTTKIDLKPLTGEKERWELYKGINKVPAFEYPFYILYLYATATLVSIESAVQYIKDHPDIHEVILSGGDPLLLNDNRLSVLLEKLSKIPHLKRIRFHSRIPIVLPSRITNEFIQLLTDSPKQMIVVTHCNHANEITEEVEMVCFSLQKNNISLLNQAVLLKGINNSADQLCKLSEKLFASGILPYYLHLLDKATGTGHFEVTENEAVKIMWQVREQLPGYLVPKLVREQTGAQFKLPVG